MLKTNKVSCRCEFNSLTLYFTTTDYRINAVIAGGKALFSLYDIEQQKTLKEKSLDIKLCYIISVEPKTADRFSAIAYYFEDQNLIKYIQKATFLSTLTGAQMTIEYGKEKITKSIAYDDDISLFKAKSDALCFVPKDNYGKYYPDKSVLPKYYFLDKVPKC